MGELADPKNFDGVTSFEGMIGLAGRLSRRRSPARRRPGVGSPCSYSTATDGILSQAKPFYEPAGKSPKLKELGTKVEDAIKDAKKCIDKYRSWYDDHVRRLLDHA